MAIVPGSNGRLKIGFRFSRSSSVGKEKEYLIGLRFEPNGKEFKETFQSFAMFKEIYKWYDEVNPELISSLSSESVVYVDLYTFLGISKNTISRFDLTGSSAALVAMEACDANWREKSEKAKKNDPFG
jgi:hypothetical protein